MNIYANKPKIKCQTSNTLLLVRAKQTVFMDIGFKNISVLGGPFCFYKNLFYCLALQESQNKCSDKSNFEQSQVTKPQNH